MEGNGSTFVDDTDYCAMVGLTLGNLTAHEAKELLAYVAVVDPAVFAYALSMTGVCYCA